MNQALVLVLFLPFIVVLWLANMANRQREHGQDPTAFVVLSYGLLILFYLALIVLGGVLQIAGMVAANPDAQSQMTQSYQQSGMNPEIARRLVTSLPLIGLGLWLPSLIGIILLLPPVRHLLARILPINPDSPVQAVALSFGMPVVTQMLVTLGVGLGNLVTLTEDQAGASALETLPTFWMQTLGLVLMALIGVGWLSRRSFGEALTRLGVVVPRLQQVASGLVIALTLVVVIIVLEFLLSKIGVRADTDVSKLTEQLLGPLFRSIPGILTLGISAALGEEAVFRGALQPRFGLILTALLFALLHSTYGLTVSTAVVFLLGLVLGYVRLRANTTTSMIVHAVYNMTLGVLALLNINLNF